MIFRPFVLNGPDGPDKAAARQKDGGRQILFNFQITNKSQIFTLLNPAGEDC
jgi:hypothetical protein